MDARIREHDAGKHLIPTPVMLAHASIHDSFTRRPDSEGTGGETAIDGGWVYIMSNRPNGTLHIGVTADLARRAWEHRTGATAGFTSRYGLTRLVYAEFHDSIRLAIEREKAMKQWRRAWKVRLIQTGNPDWADLYDTLA